LQPLAENALYHGVKEKRGKSTILIDCKRSGEEVILTVTDDGIGMQPDKLNAVRTALESSEHIGFGLLAVHERIKLYFGNAFGVSISSEYGSGTTVKVCIPQINQLSS